MAKPETKPDAQPESKPAHGPKETISSLIIAFVFAFVFRGFVVEAFVIPTGSMAPTLLGKHTRYQSPESGYTWTADPAPEPGGASIVGVGGSNSVMSVSDPMTGARIGQELPAEMGKNQPLLSGDRIFVLKYLYSIYDPSRFDVVVFKYPGQADSVSQAGQQENYIKRLLGLPGEEIALVDGDLFRRSAADQKGAPTYSDWSAEGWEIARKSERVQRELWQPVYSSEYSPLNQERNLRPWFESPWQGRTADGATDSAWDTSGRSYNYAGAGATTLAWDNDARPITDYYYYNEKPASYPAQARSSEFGVSDVRLAMGVEPEQSGMTLAAVLDTRGHEFRADLGGGRVTIRMRPMVGDEPGAWRTIAEDEAPALEPGRVTNVEFWHVDQTVQVWVEGDRVAMGEYDWTPALRIENALDAPVDMLLRAASRGNPLDNTQIYPEPTLRWELAGSPVTLHRVRLDRDIFYRPGTYSSRPMPHTRQGQPALATHPSQPLLLGADQFFVCGDNSPNSLDGRAWDTPDPWVYQDIDTTMGIVPRELLIGKAFFVYFPGLHREGRVPMPDVGRMRFIW